MENWNSLIQILWRYMNMLNTIKNKITNAMDSMYDYISDHPMASVVLSYGCSLIGVAVGVGVQHKHNREVRKLRKAIEAATQILENQK